MFQLGRNISKLKNAFVSRSVIWGTEHIPLNRSRYKVRGVVAPPVKKAALKSLIEYPVGNLRSEVEIDRALYESTADFMRRDPYAKSSISMQQIAAAWKLSQGRVYTNRTTQYFVISNENLVLAPASFKHEDALEGVPEEQLQVKASYFPEPEKLSGRVLNLILGGGASSNIFHWMIDALPALKLAQEVGPLSEIDHVLVQGKDNGFRLKSLEMFGIPSERVRFYSQQLIHVEAEELIATSHPRSRMSNLTPGWAIDFHRQTVLPQLRPNTGQYPGKIYISRRDSALRGVVNEAEVIEQLEARGFKAITLSEHSYDEKAALFHHAREIVSMSGAALAFLMYCKPGARVLELFPAGFVHYSNAAIANQVEVDHHYLIFGDTDTGKDGYHAQREEMVVDISQLQAAL